MWVLEPCTIRHVRTRIHQLRTLEPSVASSCLLSPSISLDDGTAVSDENSSGLPSVLSERDEDVELRGAR